MKSNKLADSCRRELQSSQHVGMFVGVNFYHQYICMHTYKICLSPPMGVVLNGFSRLREKLAPTRKVVAQPTLALSSVRAYRKKFTPRRSLKTRLRLG
jgi:hypothetical protein